MTRYRLKFRAADGDPESRTVCFEAEDAASALLIAHQQAERASAELWNEERALCTIRRTGPAGQVWWVGPPQA